MPSFGCITCLSKQHSPHQCVSPLKVTQQCCILTIVSQPPCSITQHIQTTLKPINYYMCLPSKCSTMYCRLPKFRWDVIWLPFGPLRYIIEPFICILFRLIPFMLNTITILAPTVELQYAYMWIICFMNPQRKFESSEVTCMLTKQANFILSVQCQSLVCLKAEWL